MSLLNVAVWGLGNHTKNRILPALAAIDEIKLYGVCSRNDDTVTESAEQWNCCGWHSPEEMLTHPALDVIYVSTPIGLTSVWQKRHSRLVKRFGAKSRSRVTSERLKPLLPWLRITVKF